MVKERIRMIHLLVIILDSANVLLDMSSIIIMSHVAYGTKNISIRNSSLTSFITKIENLNFCFYFSINKNDNHHYSTVW